MQNFSQAVLIAQGEAAQGRLENALHSYQEALPFAETDFKKSYLWGEIAACLLSLDRLQEATEADQHALDFAEKVPWPDFVVTFSLELANLYCHLGKPHASEVFFQKGLSILKTQGEEHAWIRNYQNFGNALMEQAKYAEALRIFQECEKFLKKHGQPEERAAIAINSVQGSIYLGMSEAAEARLQEVQELLQKEGMDFLFPYLQLLEGKFEIIQGRIAEALRILEKAAQGFEAAGDLPGKIEVLLTITAPLIEYNLFKEAHGLILQISTWPELEKYPALAHSVHLRRLGLSAFLGRWVKSDMELISQDSREVGRAEDWLQFWFHLSLAGRRINDLELAKVFLGNARGIAERILQGLTEAQKKFFIRRPDIARLWRLTEVGTPAETQKVRRKRALPSAGPADAATLAPPDKGK